MSHPTSSELRVGLVGLDSTHAVAFTRLLNATHEGEHVAGARVVTAYPGGSPDFPLSASRRDAIRRQIADEFALPLCESVEELAGSVDAVMILSADGRAHLAEATRALASGKPLFVDKPMAASWRDADELVRRARQARVPCFSSSALRFSPAIVGLQAARIGELRGALACGPASYEPFHPELSWYGIHTVEALYTVMGPGCRTVVRTHTEHTDVVTGVWADGRVGTIRCTRRSDPTFSVTVFGTDGSATAGGFSYAPLVAKVVTFFATGVPPVAAEETLEILAFIDGADVSRQRDGTPVALAEVTAPAFSAARSP